VRSILESDEYDSIVLEALALVRGQDRDGVPAVSPLWGA
jgi:hypothetical protein